MHSISECRHFVEKRKRRVLGPKLHPSRNRQGHDATLARKQSRRNVSGFRGMPLSIGLTTKTMPHDRVKRMKLGPVRRPL